MSLLVAPDPRWAAMAAAELDRWRERVPGVTQTHHIGSTAVPGLPAKPILDLLIVFRSETTRETAAEAVMALGYDWLGAHGVPGRAYARTVDPETGAHRVHAHGYAEGHANITRLLAFRDALRATPPLRAAYASVKGFCAARHPAGGEGYQVCKSEFVSKAEARALERFA